jgi:DNA-binding transcriptional MerR regulator
MPVKADNEEYYTIAEACEYLGGISAQTLRLRARENNVQPYKQGLTKKIYYRKSDLDRIKAFRPVSRNEEKDSE